METLLSSTGHRGSAGRGPATPRRASVATTSKSLPGTPKTPRKLSMTAPLNTTHSGSTARPASPLMRCVSPGPGRVLTLSTKNSIPQPSKSVTSPVISNKQPDFSSAQTSKVSQNEFTGSSSSSGISVGSFVKQSQANLSRQLSSSSTGSQSGTTGSATAGHRAPSPSQKRSESPSPAVAARLRSPSPSPAAQKAQGRHQSAPTTQRCQSPVKQITLSELR